MTYEHLSLQGKLDLKEDGNLTNSPSLLTDPCAVCTSGGKEGVLISSTVSCAVA